jgi:hypothetical protein
MKKRGVRDQMVLATKYTTAYRATFGDKEIIANTGGNGAKSLHLSVQKSLETLQTSYIDLVSASFTLFQYVVDLLTYLSTAVCPLVGLLDFNTGAYALTQ